MPGLPYLAPGRGTWRAWPLCMRGTNSSKVTGKQGWEDVTDVLKLGRHLEMDPMIDRPTLGYTVETNAIEAAAPYLPELKPVLPEAASAALDALPAGPTLSQMVLKEKQIGLAVADPAAEGSRTTQARLLARRLERMFFAPDEKREVQNRELLNPPRLSTKPSRCWKTHFPSTISWRR